MSLPVRIVVVVVLVSLCASCVGAKIHQTDHFDAPTGVQTLAIDARQRVVLFAKVPGKPTKPGETPPTITQKITSPNGVTKEDKTVGNYFNVTCAEPSPDALSALSSGVGAGLSNAKLAASLAVSQAESAASMGLRTQSIQLLRDGMYRLCEGYAGGALDSEEFNRQQRRYQNLMLSLLAIEQLTGAVTARQVGLGEGSASASMGDKANEAAANLAKANSDLADAKEALKKAQDTRDSNDAACKAANNPADPTCTKSTDDKSAVDQAQMKVDEANQNQKTNQQAMLAARSAARSEAGGAKVNFSPDADRPSTITEGTARYIAEATRTIVSTTLLASFAQEECTKVWAALEKIANGELIFSSNDPDISPVRVPREDPPLQDQSSTVLSLRQIYKDELVHLAKNCQTNQTNLFQRAALFSPQYDSGPKPALKVLGADEPIALALKEKKMNLTIVGGAPPYHLNDMTAAQRKELNANIPTPNDATYSLELERPASATKTSGTAAVYVVDSGNAYVMVTVSLTGEPAAAAPKPAATKPTGTIGAVTSASSKFEVSLEPPKGIELSSIVVTAIDLAKPDRKALSKTEKPDAKSSTLGPCIVGDSYRIDAVFTPKSGAKITASHSQTRSA